MAQVIGKGFQMVEASEVAGSIEVLYWLAPSGECFTTWERQFDAVNFDKRGQAWHVSEGLPAGAEFIGNYAKPAAITVFGC